jgi:CRISPR/Cas system Type II protein with McrA/HNH and RuvC-like nuclease domain
MRTRHHIYPKSRGGTNSRDNISYVNGSEHQRYHSLFGNRTPREIIVYLNRTFWNEKYSEIEKLASKIE